MGKKKKDPVIEKYEKLKNDVFLFIVYRHF